MDAFYLCVTGQLQQKTLNIQKVSQSACLAADKDGKGRPIGYIFEVQQKAGKYCLADSHAADEVALVVPQQEVRHIDAKDSCQTAAFPLGDPHIV